jgi:hypothetical protein
MPRFAAACASEAFVNPADANTACADGLAADAVAEHRKTEAPNTAINFFIVPFLLSIPFRFLSVVYINIKDANT